MENDGARAQNAGAKMDHNITNWYSPPPMRIGV